ncbi:uncharacterized protein LOC134177040 isoform X2 [Corticium candelabrum]|nr:uncharacterized protein LOC134177040 isoform X2 [Corticium candelabrum]
MQQYEYATLRKQVRNMRQKYSDIHVALPRVIIHVCEHGGQEDLFSSFAPFLSSNSVYLMVYDVSIPLEAEAQSSVRLNIEGDYRHLKVKLHHMKYNKDWINHHLSTISVGSVSNRHQLADESRSETEEKLTNVSYTESTGNAVVKSSTQGIGSVFDCVSPPVIFTATHADKIGGKEEEVMRKQDAVLNRMLRDKPYTGHVYRRPPESQSPLFKSELCFCIDNTKSHPPLWQSNRDLMLSDSEDDSEQNLEEDSELVLLRNLILSRIEEHCTQELIPLTWLLIEDKVYEIRDNSHDKIIPFEKFVKVGVEQCSMKSSSEVSDALSHLHNFSIVVYFASSPTLRHYVFIDANWVFTSLSRLCPLHSTGLPANLRMDFDMLTKKGIMSQELANYFFRDVKDEDRSKILEAAEVLDIVSKHEKSEQDIEYFVPSALREDCEATVEVPNSSSEIASPAPLVLRPDNVGMFIESLFFRLLNRCVRQYPYKPSISRNYALLHMENGCDIEVFYVYYYVVVVLTPEESLSFEEVRESCIDARKFIVNSLQAAKQQGLGGFKFSVCFQHLMSGQASFLPINSDRLVSLNDYPKYQRLLYPNDLIARLKVEEKKPIDIWFDTKDHGKQHASESALFTGNVEQGYVSITRAVVHCGSSHWHEIGLRLGMNEDQIKLETRDQPRYTGKLRALIEARRAKVSEQQTIEDLLKACRWIPQPIYDDVIQQWQKEGLGQ